VEIMSNPNKEGSFVQEFKQFLQNVWAILAGISVLFPLSNALAEIIPLARWPEGGLAYFSPELVSIVSTLACLFIILWTFGHRRQFGRRRLPILKTAGLSFSAGIIALIIYLTIQYVVANDFYYNVLGLESDSSWRMFGDIFLLLACSAFFVLVTRAFMLLGVVEYFGRKRHTV
jgi:hypothetical protein